MNWGIGETQPRRQKIGILGANGTAGTELVRLVSRHAFLDLVFATSRSHAGRSLTSIDPTAPALVLDDPSSAQPDDVDLVFSCLPHGASAPEVERFLDAGVRVVDLSADYRLRDAGLHARVYGSPRTEGRAAEGVYGLTEFTRWKLRRAQLVANPGCYPTCVSLALLPLVKRGWVLGPVFVDAKSGISGAGRSPTPQTHFLAAHGDVRPYSLGRAHRHTAEMEQSFSDYTPTGRLAPNLIFNPHVVPIERGMLATIVVRTPGRSAVSVRDALFEAYAEEPVVEVLEEGPAQLRSVVRTNRAQIAVTRVAGSDHLVLTSVIDNLGKGAAGQALQNANRMLGLPEVVGVLDAPTALGRREVA